MIIKSPNIAMSGPALRMLSLAGVLGLTIATPSAFAASLKSEVPDGIANGAAPSTSARQRAKDAWGGGSHNDGLPVESTYTEGQERMTPSSGPTSARQAAKDAWAGIPQGREKNASYPDDTTDLREAYRLAEGSTGAGNRAGPCPAELLEWRDVGLIQELVRIVDRDLREIQRVIAVVTAEKIKMDREMNIWFGYGPKASSNEARTLAGLAGMLRTATRVVENLINMFVPAESMLEGAGRLSVLVSAPVYQAIKNGNEAYSVVSVSKEELNNAIKKLVLGMIPLTKLIKFGWDLADDMQNMKKVERDHEELRGVQGKVDTYMEGLEKELRDLQRELEAAKVGEHRIREINKQQNEIARACNGRKKDNEETLTDKFEKFDSQHLAKIAEETARRKQAAEAARQAQMAVVKAQAAENARQARRAAEAQAQSAGLKETGGFWEDVLDLAPGAIAIGGSIAEAVLQHKLNKAAARSSVPQAPASLPNLERPTYGTFSTGSGVDDPIDYGQSICTITGNGTGECK